MIQEPKTGTDLASSARLDDTSRRRSSRAPVFLAGALFLVTIVATTLVTQATLRQPQDLAPALDQSEANTLVLTQQMDEVFQLVRERLQLENELTAASERLLNTWMQFDEQFVTENVTNAALRLERATAHRRLGYGLYLMGQGEPSLRQFQDAIALFDELGRDHPSVNGYISEAADTYALMGWVMQSYGQLESASDAYRASIRLMTDPRVPADAARAERLAELQQQLQSLVGRRTDS